MPETRLALLGVGQVGQALLELLSQDARELTVVSATDSSGTVLDPDGLDPQAVLAAKTGHGTVTEAPGQARAWTSLQAAARAPADVVVQLTPSQLVEPRRELAELEAALGAGRHVVSAAKGARALRPDRVAELAEVHERRVLASASVGGAVPVLETLGAAFRGDRIERIEAVLNGSTTWILSKMEEGHRFEAALGQARQAGLLEADPTDDLTGRDAAAKAALLHQAAYRSQLPLDRVRRKGLGDLGEAACQAARDRGFAVRLLARIDEAGASVAPAEIPRESPLAAQGSDAVIRVVLRNAGAITLGGPGAGPRETASTVLSDLLSLGGHSTNSVLSSRPLASTSCSWQ